MLKTFFVDLTFVYIGLLTHKTAKIPRYSIQRVGCVYLRASGDYPNTPRWSTPYIPNTPRSTVVKLAVERGWTLTWSLSGCKESLGVVWSCLSWMMVG